MQKVRLSNSCTKRRNTMSKAETFVEISKRWRNERAHTHTHTYASENADHYRGFDAGRQACADEQDAQVAKLRALAEKMTCVNEFPESLGISNPIFCLSDGCFKCRLLELLGEVRP